ncbi:hypothetical protein BC833DRAFT_568502 [Globomyces pollinis-pini]|nr:hypothetical protein BC833DRAFT_568502 [Globomyces pollinis-pini]
MIFDIQRILIYYSILLIQIYCTKIVQPQWYHSLDCKGAPSSIYILNISSTSIFEPEDGEAWPNYFTLNVQLNGLGYCGAYSYSTYSQCCISSLDMKLTEGYGSAMTAFLDDDESNLVEMMPKDANGNLYCYIQPNTTTLTPTLFNQMLFLAQDDCIDDTYVCSPNGTFTVYSNSSCTGVSETFPLKSIESTHLSSQIGFFNGNMKTIQNANNSMIWLTYTPPTLIVPNTTHLPDILTHVCQIVYFLCILAVLVKPLAKICNSSNMVITLTVILNLFRIVVHIVHIFYWYYVLPEWNYVLYLGEVYYTVTGLESLATVAFTAYLIIKLKLIDVKIWLRVCLGILILAVHWFFYGSNYFFICQLSTLKLCISISTFYEWRIYSKFWIIFVFAWNTIPVILIPIRYRRKYSAKESFLKSVIYILRLDTIYTNLLLLQLIIIIAYFVLGMIQNAGWYLGDDRAYYFFGHIRRTIVGVEEVTIAVMIERIRDMISNKFRRKRKKKVKKTEETKVPNQPKSVQENEDDPNQKDKETPQETVE